MFPPNTRILIVDDVESLRDLLRAYLHRHSYLHTDTAEDGESALNLLWTAQNAGVPFQLVISDWNMPKMTGIELIKKIRQVAAWRGLPFLLLTTESEKEKVLEAVLAGVNNYLIKPVDEDALYSRLQKIWDKLNP